MFARGRCLLLGESGLDRTRACFLLLVCVALAASGCSRTRYRLRADRQAYSILEEKSAAAIWAPPLGFSATPDPRSRFFDPTPPDDPALPIPAPRLYAYQLPELSKPSKSASPPEELELIPPGKVDLSGISTAAPATVASHSPTGDVQPATFLAPLAEPLVQPPPAPPAAPLSKEAQKELEEPENPINGGLRIAPVPSDVWDSLPLQCLKRMFEFESVRSEYERTHSAPPAASQRDSSQRLTIEHIIELAQINSREYQTQKETLYRTALRLTLQRYDYQLKFSRTGNSSATDFLHRRDAGLTVNTLNQPTRFSGDQVLATGGDLLARFANDVVLTFNGPNGFAADVGSDLLLNFSQSVFQRDIIFERLTQAERNVVYSSRTYARFRKVLFRDLASQYYDLLLTYRSIEINSQDYFSNLRAFLQGEAEYRAGRVPRFQVDQFEQNALRSRSNLIRSCNTLEAALDRLKIRIGLPTEMPLNLALGELEKLTRNDEATVSMELVRRSRRNLQSEMALPAPDQGVVVNGASDLARRMSNLAKLRSNLGRTASGDATLSRFQRRFAVEESRLSVQFSRAALEQEKSTQPPDPISLFQRTSDLAEQLLNYVDRQISRLKESKHDESSLDDLNTTYQELLRRQAKVEAALDRLNAEQLLKEIPNLLKNGEAFLQRVEQLAADAAAPTLADDGQGDNNFSVVLEEVQRLLTLSSETLTAGGEGLLPLELDVDEAMLTGLTLRFDLANQRGALADVWRQIKLRGDDLRSVLNLSVSQTVRTRSDVNRVFDFTFDESQTRLRMALDTPFNRRAQRNSFRESLLDYQASLRRLITAEDNIKLAVRDDLRNLPLDRELYQIAVASAALAFERVVSTRLQLQLGARNVAARDFLEAQTAYTAALSAVAREHIRFLKDRIQLFLDLELLEVGQDGFWEALNDEQYKPQPNYDFPATSPLPYGQLPPGVRYSPSIHRMMHIPPGAADSD